MERYEEIVRVYLLQTLGNVRLQKLATTKMQEAYNTVRRRDGEALAPSTRRYIHVILKSAIAVPHERPGFEPSAEDYNRVRATYGIFTIQRFAAPRSPGSRKSHPPAIATTVASTTIPISGRRNDKLISSFPCADIRHCLSKLGFEPFVRTEGPLQADRRRVSRAYRRGRVDTANSSLAARPRPNRL